MPRPATTEKKGCGHSVLDKMTKGEQEYAVCLPCKRIWPLRPEVKP